MKHIQRSKMSLLREIATLKNELAQYKKIDTNVDEFKAAMRAVQIEYPAFSWAKLRDPSRDRNLVEPRQIWQYLCATYTRKSLKTIGDMSNRHHSCVIHSRALINDLKLVDRGIAQKVKSIEKFYKEIITE